MPSAPTSAVPSISRAVPSGAANRAVTHPASSRNPASRQPACTPPATTPPPGGVPTLGLLASAVGGELRRVVAGMQAARLRPDRLPQVVHVGQAPGADCHGVELRQQAELGQLADRVRQDVDADAERAHLRRRFQHLAGDAAGVEHQRQDQAADAAARDEHRQGRRRRAVQGWPAPFIASGSKA